MRGRKTGGRRKGTPNIPTPLKQAARVYTIEALHVLAGIMRSRHERSRADRRRPRNYSTVATAKRPQAHTDSEGGPLIPARVEHVHVTG